MAFLFMADETFVYKRIGAALVLQVGGEFGRDWDAWKSGKGRERKTFIEFHGEG